MGNIAFFSMLSNVRFSLSYIMLNMSVNQTGNNHFLKKIIRKTWYNRISNWSHPSSLSFPVCVSDPQMFFLPPILLFIFPWLPSCLLSPPHVSCPSQIFRGLSLTSVLSCLPYTVSSLLWGDKTTMSSTYEPSALLFPPLTLWDSSPGRLSECLTVIWKPWRTHSHQIQPAV